MRVTETYAQRVGRARDELGLTQEDFAIAVGIPYRTLQDIESGKVTQPHRRTREKIDAYLGLHAESETVHEWTDDVHTFMLIVGAYLNALPPAERTKRIQQMIREIAD